MEMVETFSVAEFGVQGQFNERERFMIHDPLVRLIERYSALADRYTNLIDPVMILIGTGMFAVRLGNAYEASLKRVSFVGQNEAPQPQGNGSNGTAPTPSPETIPPASAFPNPNDYFRPADS